MTTTEKTIQTLIKAENANVEAVKAIIDGLVAQVRESVEHFDPFDGAGYNDDWQEASLSICDGLFLGGEFREYDIMYNETISYLYAMWLEDTDFYESSTCTNVKDVKPEVFDLEIYDDNGDKWSKGLCNAIAERVNEITLQQVGTYRIWGAY